jgi:hypothetical protein
MSLPYADATKPAPVTILLDPQPYGEVTLGDLKWGEYRGAPTLSGKVIAGTTTSRLFQHASTRSAVGEHRTIYGVKAHEIAAGRCVRIAC